MGADVTIMVKSHPPTHSPVFPSYTMCIIISSSSSGSGSGSGSGSSSSSQAAVSIEINCFLVSIHM